MDDQYLDKILIGVLIHLYKIIKQPSQAVLPILRYHHLCAVLQCVQIRIDAVSHDNSTFF